MHLTADERGMLARDDALGTAARIVVETGRAFGADRLVAIDSAHIDGCLYHGDAGVLFAEHLADHGGRVAVPATLNVGALDLIHPELVSLAPARRAMALRMAAAYERLGCRTTWTCAPYQVGHRPSLGRHVAWGESNAVVFANSVLGARTLRYGDFLDIAAAIVGRVPHVGLHTDEGRRAGIRFDIANIKPALQGHEAFFATLGALVGGMVGSAVPVVSGLGIAVSEDRLKAFGAAAASTGSVGLFHMVGVTPEAPDLDTATGGETVPTVHVSAAMLRNARDSLSSATGGAVDAVALGSPHFSLEEFATLERLLGGRKTALPLYACTSRQHFDALKSSGSAQQLEAQGVTFVIDTCVIVTEILPRAGGVLMTNSAKFAHYALGNIGYRTLFSSLADCVETAIAGRLIRDETVWQ